MESKPPCGCGGSNKVKRELLDSLESLRSIVGVQITPDCIYRCPEHNRAVGGAPNSQHLLGIAADIRILGLTPAEMYRAALQVPAFAAGGIGVSLNPQGYIHVDCRPNRTRWCYDAVTGKECAWDPRFDLPTVVT